MVGVELEGIRDILRLYCKALTGKSVQILSTKELAERGIGWTSVDKPTTEGSSVFIPPLVDDFDSPRENFDFYKVLVTHQAGHMEFGTFDFCFERSGSVFADFRHLLALESSCPSGAISDYEAFFDLFPDRRLASDIFTVVEDTRIDSRLRLEYRGIRQAHTRARLASASRRHPIPFLPLREAIIEVLIRISLEHDVVFSFPARYLDELRNAVGILRIVKESYPLVEDSAEATIRLYCVLAEVPNRLAASMRTVQVRSLDLLDGQQPEHDDDLRRWLERFKAIRERPPVPDEEHPYKSSEDVRFRGGFKPELVQTLSQLGKPRAEENQEESAVSADALKQMLRKSVEFESENRGNWFDPQRDFVTENLLKIQERSKLLTSQARARRIRRSVEGAGSVKTEGEVLSFYYDEWDHIANNYRTTWCHLKQKCLSEGSAKFFEDTVRNYSALLSGVKKQFAMLKPEGFKRQRKLQDGEEIDFDAIIEAMVDKRTGWTPSDKLYSRRRKTQRDVAVVFLLDMSASTGERIKEGSPAPGGPKLGNRPSPGDKRIIDVEKESLVLLIRALESIGDKYGIYGFSGSGREDVQFYVIKDLNEDLSEKVKRRIDNVAPVQGTRMGPAIRHAISILERQEAKTRLLILLSDGRPQDVDYGPNVGDHPFVMHWFLGMMPVISAEEDIKEREYAIHDTKMALNEARQRDIIPFCLSIDKLGHDYLRIMCGDIGYEVLDDIEALPRRLPSLYRRLTT